MTKKYRDGMFRDYFSDKRRLLGLCNLLTGEDATDPNEIIINTLDGVFFDSFKNDISCLFRGKFLVIVEHQSTVNENMPLRILFYAAELFKQYVDEHKGKLYAEQRITLPEPKFFVFYNGSKAEAAYREMRLSEAFGKRTCLEVVVEHYNINAGMNDEFVSRDESLDDYCTFINLVHEFKAQGMDLEHAIAAAFKYCLEHGIMVEYLLSRKKELASMLALEYDAELARQALLERGREEGLIEGIAKGREEGLAKGREEGLAEGREEGLAKGREEGLAEGFVKKAREMVKSLLTTDLPMKEIARVAGWTEEEVRKFAEAEKIS